VLEEYSLKGKVDVVTGSGKDIGRGIALTLAEAGADIVSVDKAAVGDSPRRWRGSGRRTTSTSTPSAPAGP
jgi:2-deoxy-D-gluconate 3-dehydrogenase